MPDFNNHTETTFYGFLIPDSAGECKGEDDPDGFISPLKKNFIDYVSHLLKESQTILPKSGKENTDTRHCIFQTPEPLECLRFSCGRGKGSRNPFWHMEYISTRYVAAALDETGKNLEIIYPLPYDHVSCQKENEWETSIKNQLSLSLQKNRGTIQRCPYVINLYRKRNVICNQNFRLGLLLSRRWRAQVNFRSNKEISGSSRHTCCR